MRPHLKLLVVFLILSIPVPAQLAQAYRFNQNARGWSDSEVESFLFLTQVQKRTGLGKNSRMCIDISEPVPGGKQTMRIISKVGDNKEGGLFQTGKCEIAKGGPQESDLNVLKQVVGMASGYQQAIMDLDMSTGAPKTRDASEVKRFMSAEVIGYTDGQPVGKNQSCELDGSGKNYSTNKGLGMYRSQYLAKELGLGNQFATVANRSIESEKALKGKENETIRDCGTWRTAEVRMNFQTGSAVSEDATWAMSTRMAPEKHRLMMQYEAALQVKEMIQAVNRKILRVEKPWPAATPDPANPNAKINATPTPEKPYSVPSEGFEKVCAAALDSLILAHGYRFNGCKRQTPRTCYYDCPNMGKLHIQIPTSADGSIWNQPYVSLVMNDSGTRSGIAVNEVEKTVKENKIVLDRIKELKKGADPEIESAMLKAFPECAKDPASLQDLRTLIKQVRPVMGSCTSQSPHVSIKSDDPCAQAAIISASDGTGKSGKLMKCVNMKRVMGQMYAQGECRPGGEFSKITFPHMNAHLGCKYCGNGWSTKNGAASFSERFDGKVTRFSDQNTSFDTPTYKSLQSPGIHEISDCADCSCTNKGEKVKKVFIVEEANPNKGIMDQVNKTSCYCTPPVAPSCGVGPQGATGESVYSSLGQKYFYDSCKNDFVKVTESNKQTDQKGSQILALVNQMNQGCWNQPGACKEVDLPTAITTVNQMLCETQNYRIPSDDPVKDCQKEDEISKPLPKEE